MELFTPVSHPNEILLAVGPEGTGKTYLAATAPGPIYVIGTEAGHEVVTLAKHFPDKEIHHLAIEPENEEDSAPEIWFGSWWEKDRVLMNGIKELESAPHGTVVIDSASDLLGIAAASYNVQFQRGDDPIPPLYYGQIYSLLQGWVGRLRKSHNVVLTARTKKKYVDDKKTDEDKIDLWKTGPYMADSVVWMSKSPIGRASVARVTKGVNRGLVKYSATWDDIVDPAPVERDDRPMIHALRRLDRCYSWARSKGKPVKRIVPNTLSEVNERIAAVKEHVAPSNSKNEDEPTN